MGECDLDALLHLESEWEAVRELCEMAVCFCASSCLTLASCGWRDTGCLPITRDCFCFRAGGAEGRRKGGARARWRHACAHTQNHAKRAV